MANESSKLMGQDFFYLTDKVAYKLLYIIFIIAPIIAGTDKFFDKLVDWDMYLAPSIAKLMPFDPMMFMRIAGAIEVIAGIIVAIIPRVGAFIVSAWLLLITANLLLIPGYFDVALRDFGLAFAAFALGLLSIHHSCKCKAYSK